MAEGAERSSFGAKTALFPGIKREDHRVVLWREHVTKEAKHYPGDRPFAIADTRTDKMGRYLVDGKPPMATRPQRRQRGDQGDEHAQVVAWGRASARAGSWGRRSARNRLSLTLGQRAEPLLESVSMPELRGGDESGLSVGGIENLPADFTFEIDPNESFSHRNSLPARNKNRGMSVGGKGGSRYSEHSWGPILMKGRVPRTESQNLGWAVPGHQPGQPLVKPKHAMKRLRQRAAMQTCEEVACECSPCLAYSYTVAARAPVHATQCGALYVVPGSLPGHDSAPRVPQTPITSFRLSASGCTRREGAWPRPWTERRGTEHGGCMGVPLLVLVPAEARFS
jgi:hypothetical protein